MGVLIRRLNQIATRRWHKSWTIGFFMLIVIMPILFSPARVTASENQDSHWWSGFSITPGIGARHLGLDVVRKSDGFKGNISQKATAKAFASLSVSTSQWNFGDSNFGIALRAYSSVVTLDHQFFDFNSTNPTTGTNEGDRIDVGTQVKGYYSYVVPALQYSMRPPGGGEMKFGLGMGLWDAKFEGDIILTANNQPAKGDPKTEVNFKTKNEWAYLFFMSYLTQSAWLFEMAVGGPEFEDRQYEYQVEEVSLIVGKTFTL